MRIHDPHRSGLSIRNETIARGTMMKTDSSDAPGRAGPAYPLRESIGWLWRNIFGIRKTNPCGIRPLPQQVVLNAIRPQMTFGFVGDIMPMGRKTLDISPDVIGFFQDCDYLIGNLEGTITTARRSCVHAQRHHASILLTLSRLFPPDRTLLSVANNHAGDFPAPLFRQSVDWLRDHGFQVFGLHETPFIDIAGCVRIAGASMWRNRPCEEVPYLDHLVGYVQARALCIAYPHWGYELELYPRSDMVQTGRRLLDGYDAVLGHHPHVPQPLTAIRHGQATKLLAFSLGDFMTALPFKKFQYGAACKMTVGPGRDGRWRIGAVLWRFTRIRRVNRNTLKITFVPGLAP